jgi:hypothetical protein
VRLRVTWGVMDMGNWCQPAELALVAAAVVSRWVFCPQKHGCEGNAKLPAWAWWTVQIGLTQQGQRGTKYLGT